MIPLAALTLLAAQPDPLLASLSAPEGEPPRCSSTFTIEIEQGEERDRRVYRYDAETGERVLVEGSDEAMAEDANRRADAEAKPAEEAGEEEDDEEGESVSFGMIPYAVAIRTDGFAYTRQGTEDGLVLFEAGPPLPKGTFEASGRDMSKRAASRLWVEPGETPVLRRHAYDLVKEFQVPMIARVRTLRQVTEYEEVAGRVMPVRFSITFDAEMMGKTQAGMTEVALSDFECPSDAGD